MKMRVECDMTRILFKLGKGRALTVRVDVYRVDVRYRCEEFSTPFDTRWWTA
jgi:hypothetical protein